MTAAAAWWRRTAPAGQQSPTACSSGAHWQRRAAFTGASHPAVLSTVALSARSVARHRPSSAAFRFAPPLTPARVPARVPPPCPARHPPPRSPDQRAQVVSLRAIFLRRMTKVMEERRGILAKLQQVNIPDRMMALQSVISETLKVGGWGVGAGGCWLGAAGLVSGWVAGAGFGSARLGYGSRCLAMFG